MIRYCQKVRHSGILAGMTALTKISCPCEITVFLSIDLSLNNWLPSLHTILIPIKHFREKELPETAISLGFRHKA